MSDLEERRAQGLLLRIDTTRCAGYMACRSIAPEAFELGHAGTITFRDPEQVERERLIEACAACPAQALSVLDEHGSPLVPR